MRYYFLSATLLIAVAGCPEVRDGVFACQQSSDCHSSQSCFDGFCFSAPPADASIDGQMDTLPDAMSDATQDSTVDASVDTVPDMTTPPDVEPPRPPVDLLILLDNSPSMSRRRNRVIEGIEALITELSWADLRLAFITPDLANPMFLSPSPPSCRGGGSTLQVPSEGNIAGQSVCNGQEPFTKFLSGPSLTREKVACYIEQLGTCGVELTLESLLQALSKNSRSDFFPGSARGTFDQDFHRSGAKKIIVVITDEDDCSAPNPEFYNPLTPAMCVSRIEMLKDADSFAQAMPNAADTVLGVLAGVPTTLSFETAETIFNSPEMVPAVDLQGAPRKVCQDVSPASAAKRIVGFGGAFRSRGASDLYASICETDYKPFMRAIANEARSL